MRRPSIRLLGRIEVVARNGTPIQFHTRRSKELLIILVLAGAATCNRELVAAAIWAEGGDGCVRNRLNTEVWRLRRTLAAAGEVPDAWVVSQGADLAFRADGPVAVDVLRFDALLAEAGRTGDADARRRALAEAVACYGGELAPGLYGDWCLLAREAYRGRYMQALEQLLELNRDARLFPEAIDCAQAILKEDPLLEHVHRELMRCHVLMNDRAAALRHYDQLCRTLRAELNVEPTAETRALAHLLRIDGDLGVAPRGVPAQILPGAPDADEIRRIRRRLLEAARDLGAMARRLSDPALQDSSR